MDRKPRLRLLGAEVDRITPAEMLAFAASCVRQGRRAIVANHNAHSLYLAPRDAAMRALYAQADLIEIDSVPMILWGKLLGHQVSRDHRCNYLDFRGAFWDMAVGEGWRVFHLGCKPGVGEAAREAIARRHPGITLGLRHGYFDVNGPENDAVLAEIAAFKPDIVLVGMSMPRQEAWIAANLERLPNAVIYPIGAAFDYEAGMVATPPRWTGRLGIEWLYRLFCEPRRLFARYVLEPWALVPAMFGDLARAPRFRRAPHAPLTTLQRPAP
ncbi:MAG: WecB/TagA/CpsF family glycosyltransferase [Proteobacteria bacterium]|nr:WecB/TagA/CpsF family glycosyltransferase [Pseudomonadota bacterium]